MRNQSDLPENFKAALWKIEARLKPCRAPWAFTGSLGFWLHGMPVTPQDIDLQSTAEGAYQIEERLGGKRLRKVALCQAESIRSHFGALELEGVNVDIMGAVEKRRPDGSWEPPPDLEAVMEWATWQGRRLPILSLHYELEAYRLLGRTDRADEIAGFLQSQSNQYPD
jgi:hypothetical protein